MNIIITIPAYNEEETIVQVINEIKNVMSKTKYKYKLLVLDDGSTDATASLAKKAGAKVVSHLVNKGLASTFKSEMKECSKLNADIIVHTDGDGQYPAKYIPLLIKKVEEGYDLVLGSRFTKNMHAKSIVKDLTNRLFAFVLSKMLGIRIKDSTTGFRAFNKKIAGLPLINTFTYTQEQIIRATKTRLKIAEVPIKPRRTRPSRLFGSTLSYALKAWINIFRIYRDFDPIKFFGSIGSAFLFMGLIFGIWILKTFVTTGNVGGIPRVILCTLFIITGVQVIIFGFLADMIKHC